MGGRVRCVHQARQLLDRRQPPSFASCNLQPVTVARRLKPTKSVCTGRLLPDAPGLFVQDGRAAMNCFQGKTPYRSVRRNYSVDSGPVKRVGGVCVQSHRSVGRCGRRVSNSAVTMCSRYVSRTGLGMYEKTPSAVSSAAVRRLSFPVTMMTGRRGYMSRMAR